MKKIELTDFQKESYQSWEIGAIMYKEKINGVWRNWKQQDTVILTPAILAEKKPHYVNVIRGTKGRMSRYPSEYTRAGIEEIKFAVINVKTREIFYEDKWINTNYK